MIVCHRCGKENQDHYKFCLGCGGSISAAPAPVAASAAPDDSAPSGAASAGGEPEPATTAEAAPLMSAVASVTGPLDSEQGSDPAASSPTRACPGCGRISPVDFAFCGGCGMRMDAIAAPASSSVPTTSDAPAYHPVETAAPGKLVLILPDGSEGGSLPLHEGETIVGRDGTPLFEGDVYLSPRHAVLELRDGNLVVRDDGSLNGVFVKMSGEECIEDGEVFRLGQELLRFEVLTPGSPLDDGTEIMGSPNPGYWGRVTALLGRDQDGAAYPIAGESAVVGRERGDILFPDDGYVSGTHARLSRRNGQYYLADLNSSNGTFLRLRSERALYDGSFLLLGQQLFRVAL